MTMSFLLQDHFDSTERYAPAMETTAATPSKGERDGVHDDVELVPALFQRFEALGDAFIAGDVHFEHGGGVEFLGHALDAILETFLVAERKLRAFALHGFGDLEGVDLRPAPASRLYVVTVRPEHNLIGFDKGHQPVRGVGE